MQAVHLFVLVLALVSGPLFAQGGSRGSGNDALSGPSSIIFTSQAEASRGMKKKAMDGLTPLVGELIKVRGLKRPESVAIRGGKLYIANVGGNPGKSPRKGFFVVADLDGGNSRKLFAGQLDDPKGFGFFNDDLIIVSDQPSVKVLNFATETVVAELAIPGAKFLNDIAVLDRNTAVLSDSMTGTVHLVRFDGTTLTSTPIRGLDGTVAGVNGLYFANQKLYLVTSVSLGARNGNLYSASLSRDRMSGTLSQPIVANLGEALDGLYVSGDNIVISDWGNGRRGGARAYLVSESKNMVVRATGGGTALADLGVENDTWIYIPEMTRNRIIKLHVPFGMDM